MSTLAHDLRYALRMLVKSPVLTTVAVLTLALGIGANTALFSVINHVLLAPLPYPEPDRLVYLWMQKTDGPGRTPIVSMPNFLDWRSQSRSFRAMAAYETQSYNLAGEQEPEQVQGMRATASLFDVVGAYPRLGRAFTVAEETLGRDRVAVISDTLWRRRYGADPSLVGKPIKINGEMRTLIGVMPPGFLFPNDRIAMWVPIGVNDEDRGRGSQSFWAVGRLETGVPLSQAGQEMEVIAGRLGKQYPSNAGWTLALQPMSEMGIREIRSTLWMLLGAVGLVLLIACANIANLLIARAATRSREFAVRLSLGASRWRICRQLIAESLLLAGVGGMAGLLLSPWLIELLARISPAGLASLPFRQSIAPSVDLRVLGFTLAVTLLTGLLFGLFPAWSGLRAPLNDSLKEGSRGATHASGRLRAMLVLGEVALAMVVTTGAGLLIASISRLLGVEPGLNPDHVLTMRIALPQPDFYGPPQRPRFCADVDERIHTVPGVVSASAISHLPISGADAGRSFSVEGRPSMRDEDLPNARYRLICPGYFRTMGIPLRAGREFSHRDSREFPGVVMINETAARRYWPGEDPVGKRFKLGRSQSGSEWLTVSGVVGDVLHFGLDQEALPEMYRPYSQAAWPAMTLVIRTGPEPSAVAAAIRSAAGGIDRELPISQIRTMREWIDASVGPRRFPMQLLSAFGALALLLASVGVFGVMSWFVTMRTREIGIRIALGANRGTVVSLVLARGLYPVAGGIVVGIAGSLMLGRYLATLLYGVTAGDPLVLAGVAVVLFGVSALAAYLPARRATAIDPIRALRCE